MTGLFWLLAALLLGWVAIGRTRAEPRRLGNAFWLLAALLLALNALVAIGLPGGGLLVLAGGGLLLFSPLLVLALVVLLLANGVVMVRREGRSLGNLLSLLGGLALLGLALTPLLVLGTGLHPVVLAVVLFVDLAAAYLGFVLLAFLGYGRLYPRLVRGWPASWVVVLGSGLAGGERVPPLLAGRVRAGIAEARARRVPVLVLSGGRGSDEQRSEADAMAEWARTEGGLVEGDGGPRLLLEE
uniref:YdcF family protein n=1 Tax=Desertihabitans aurantiacus TaxID=2282477 RepID=UPI0018E5546A